MEKSKKNNDCEVNCRVCQDFELARIKQPNFAPTRKMAICHALEVVLSPHFPDDIIAESFVISKANERTVIFEQPDNCPVLNKLRQEGLMPWASSVIDFSNGRTNHEQ
jgi:hypothetical protein